MKALISSDTLLAYPDHNQPFTIDTDPSDFQMGAVIRQNWSKKLNSAQRNYKSHVRKLHLIACYSLAIVPRGLVAHPPPQSQRDKRHC
jgi:hypothetical protein